MARAKPSEQDEASFMNSLLSDIDSSFFDAVPSPDATPQRPKSATQMLVSSINAKLSAVAGVAPIASDTIMKDNSSVVMDDIDLTSLLEGAEDWDWNDMDKDLLSSARKRTASKTTKLENQEEPTFRCIIESVQMCNLEKKLHVVSEDRTDHRTVVLVDDWLEAEVFPGDTLNIIGRFLASSHLPMITISAKHNLLVLQPDILLTATSVANASHCVRRPLLSLLLRSASDTTPALVWGNILHEVVQRCFTALRWDTPHVQSLVDEAIQKSLGDLVRIGVTIKEARAEVLKRTRGLKAFGERYIGKMPKPDAILTNTRTEHGVTSHLAITQLYDVEEDIWAPKYGLKGKIDASIRARIEQHTKPVSQAQPSSTSESIMPFEIKTGRTIAAMEHRAQTILYTLLMTDRYSVPLPSSTSAGSPVIPGGLLYYTQCEEVTYVPAGWNEIRGLIMARNELAGYVMRRMRRKGEKKQVNNGSDSTRNNIGDSNGESFLPPTIDQQRACGRCYVADACMLYRKAVEGVEDNSSPIAKLYELKAGHLSAAQLAFFRKWEQLITLEEQDIVRFRKELWTLGAAEREEKGRCLAAMVLDPTFLRTELKPPAKDTRIHQFTYRFVRQQQWSLTLATGDCPRTQSLLHGQIVAGDAVTVSVADDPCLLALARGFVLELTPQEIILGVDHTLSSSFIRTRSARYNVDKEIIFRIDKDEMTGGMARVRDNLVQLFYVTADRRRLELIVDLKMPEFDSNVLIPRTSGYESLNPGQQKAVEHVLRARDYALILGMPGTGKTTTVAEIIRMLVGMRKTVLLTSYTHSAVDTILLKLKNIVEFDILRLGNADKVHPEVQEYTLSAKDKPSSAEQFERQLLKPAVVATTALSIDHALFSRRRFDYCIVDEASQITLPTCVGPLRLADKFILVGDHFQLPPLVKSRDAREAGFDVSLFRRLTDAHPNAVVDLAHQYRMNADIMFLSNRLIYGGRLKCGSQEVANRFLQIPYKREADPVCGMNNFNSACWLQQVIDERCKAVFVDTDALPAMESRVGDLIQNEVEASLVHQLTAALLRGGIRQEQIGIISLYRQQNKLLSHLLQEHKDIEILTADRSQGRDKDCIIISLVRANENNQVGDLLKDWRRINVAFTRARAKLVIFGSRKTLQTSPLLGDFFALMDERGWVLALPAGAKTAHHVHGRGLRSSEVPKVGATKRCSSDSDCLQLKGNLAGSHAHPYKKVKRASVENGLVRARPILQDLLNDAK